VLDALAVVGVEVFLHLRAIVRGFVDRDADLAAGAGHRLGLQARELSLDVEVADLAEIEEALVELRPLGHAAAVHVVREVVHAGKPGARRRGRLAPPEGFEAGKRLEVHVVDGVAVGVLGVAVDEINERVADALHRRDVELARARARLDAPRAALDELVVGARRVLDPPGHGAHAGAVAAREVLRERARLGVDDKVHAALLEEQHVLVPVLRHRLEAHALEERPERLRVGGGVLDELEAVGVDRVFPGAVHSAILGL
jgi:hypothetical protein